MDKHYELWVKTECPFCVKAQEALLNKGIKHTINVMDEKPDLLQEVKNKWEHKTVPIVVLVGEEEELIGGYTELAKHLNQEVKND